ncbi:hypothetical protein CL621_01310 [archaeon]|nr:hypothetical protein [archaeon]|tara:strand:- start:921 stop:1490 length:570 start_codon:yes stop_codon:yes gene_type:complete
MIISAKKVLELNEKYKLVENLSERELKNPEGVGLDIRVGEVYKIKGDGFLGVEERNTPEIEKIAGVEDKEVILKPGDYVLVKTIEKVNVPGEKIIVEEGKEPVLLMLHVYPRSTLQRCGIYFMGTKTDPGYFGELTFALKNLGDCNFKLEIGARIVNIVFKQVVGDLHREYEGQWKGGRINTEKKEKQI